jgi:hypothetical protein
MVGCICASGPKEKEKEKRTNNDLQNNTHKPEYRET